MNGTSCKSSWEDADRHTHWLIDRTAPCVPQIADLDAKLWIQESSAELFAFNDHLPQSMYGALVEKLKTVGTASGFGINEGRSEGEKKDGTTTSEQEITCIRANCAIHHLHTLHFWKQFVKYVSNLSLYSVYEFEHTFDVL